MRWVKHRGPTNVAFSEGGEHLVSGDDAGLLAIWSTSDWSLRTEQRTPAGRPIHGLAAGVRDVHFGQGGALMRAEWDGSSLRMEARDEHHRAEIVPILRTGAHLITGAYDGAAIARALRPGKPDDELIASVRADLLADATASFGPGEYAADWVDELGIVELYRDRVVVARVREPAREISVADARAAHGDFAVGDTMAEVVASEPIERPAASLAVLGRTSRIALGSPVMSLACSPHAKERYDPPCLVAAGTADGSLYALGTAEDDTLDPGEHRALHRLDAHAADVYAIDVQNILVHRARVVATSSPSDRALRIWRNDELQRDIRADGFALAFSPDGLLLAHGHDGQVVLRDGRTWEEVRRFAHGIVTSLAFSPRASPDAPWSGWLVAGGIDGTIGAWRL